jgi:acyl carrier protein
MDDVRSRLIRCFAAVFPGLTHDQIPKAQPATVTGWDSVASVTLIAAIEEEFAVEFDVQEIANVLSFAKLSEYLQSLDTASAE